MEYLFETARLKVRKFKKEDAKRLYENHLDAEVRKWIPNECYGCLKEAGEAAAFFADCVSRERLPYVLAVELKENGELIGDTGINEVEGQSGDVEIGYTICSRHSGKGYATELLGGMTAYAAAVLGYRILYGRVLQGNEASVRVLQKNGYTFEGEVYGAEDDPYGAGMLIYRKEI